MFKLRKVSTQLVAHIQIFSLEVLSRAQSIPDCLRTKNLTLIKPLTNPP